MELIFRGKEKKKKGGEDEANGVLRYLGQVKDIPVCATDSEEDIKLVKGLITIG